MKTRCTSMNRAIRYRLYPSDEQRVMLAKTFGCCRKIYNLMLEDKIAYYKACGLTLSTTPAQYKNDYPYLKEVDSLALANVQLNLQRAYRNFFDGLKKHKKVGFPQFKSAKKSRRSYTTNNQRDSIRIENSHIRLPKIGMVKAVIHRQAPADWVIKSVTISQDSSDKYYASVLFEYDDSAVPVNKNSKSAIGLDYKSDGLYMDSNGQTAPEHHKCYRLSQKRLAKLQRKLKHMTIGSSNYYKRQKAIAKLYVHTANQRKDYLHKLSTKIANSYDIVCVEDIDMQAIANRKHHLGKATYDNGYGMFVSMLQYKLEERGKYLVKIDRWYPSTQICSCCGRTNKLSLSDRTYSCECGNVMDRDANAAINILNEGLRILRQA